MSHPTIRDRDLARLPISAAREELLREITSSPTVTLPSPRSRRPRWVPIVSAAAVVAVLVAVPAYFLGGTDDPPTAGENHPQRPSATVDGPPVVPGGGWVALTGDWPIEQLSSLGPATGGLPRTVAMTYAQDQQRLSITVSPAAGHEPAKDRGGAMSATTLLGRPATLLTFDSSDHAVALPFGGSRYLDVVGEGMDLTTFRAVLSKLVETDASGLASALPRSAVTPFNRDTKVPALLEGVTLPEGFTAADVPIVGFNDEYDAAVAVGNAVRCAWLTEYQRPTTRAQALAAFDSSRRWPLLRRIASEGDYAKTFWDTSGQLRDGVTAATLRKALCP